MTATWRYRNGTEAVFLICCKASGSMSCGGKNVTILSPILNIGFPIRNQRNNVVNSAEILFVQAMQKREPWLVMPTFLAPPSGKKLYLADHHTGLWRPHEPRARWREG